MNKFMLFTSRLDDAFGNLDVTHRLSQVEVPTLVLHSRHDARVPFEAGRQLASEILNRAN